MSDNKCKYWALGFSTVGVVIVVGGSLLSNSNSIAHWKSLRSSQSAIHGLHGGVTPYQMLFSGSPHSAAFQHSTGTMHGLHTSSISGPAGTLPHQSVSGGQMAFVVLFLIVAVVIGVACWKKTAQASPDHRFASPVIR